MVSFIVDKGYDEKFGARPLRLAIQKYIEDLLSVEYIKGNLKEDKLYHLDVKNDSICIMNID